MPALPVISFRFFEQIFDETDFAYDPWSFIDDMPPFDHPNSFYGAQRIFGRIERLESPHWSDQLFQRCMIALSIRLFLALSVMIVDGW